MRLHTYCPIHVCIPGAKPELSDSIHAPLKKKRVRSDLTPWITPEVRK